MKQMQAEAEALGNITLMESDGQGSTPKQTADVEAAIIQGVDGIVISPNEVDAMAPAHRSRRSTPASRSSPSTAASTTCPASSPMSAPTTSRAARRRAQLIMKLFPDGAKIINLQGQPGASPAIDRNKGLHNVLDQQADKYQIVFEQTANFARDKGLSVTEAGARRHGRAARRDRRRQ